jgi:DNA-binding transcriptional ArsR family regulator
MATHPSKATRTASYLKVIANSTRIEIIGLLTAKKQLTVTQICNKLNIEQSLISHHLKNMRNSGILSATRDGIQIYYSIASPEVLGILKLANSSVGSKKVIA